MVVNKRVSDQGYKNLDFVNKQAMRRQFKRQLVEI